ncbi:MAG: very short patch repair endonuclease [Pirellulales bacterium]|nr:very short patch repair endonuclease [Pirellulales bacterium]
MDTLTPAQRSERMARVRCKDTKPEIAVRRLVHSLGYRYRLHAHSLPGCPDMVFSSRRKVIFVHGCFWHRHKGCPNCRLPKSRLDFWKPKLEANRQRDAKNRNRLRKLGWRILIVWECEVASAVPRLQRIYQHHHHQSQVVIL